MNKAYTIGELLEHIAALNLPPDAPVVLDCGGVLQFPVVAVEPLFRGGVSVSCLRIGIMEEPELPTRTPAA